MSIERARLAKLAKTHSVARHAAWAADKAHSQAQDLAASAVLGDLRRLQLDRIANDPAYDDATRAWARKEHLSTSCPE